MFRTPNVTMDNQAGTSVIVRILPEPQDVLEDDVANCAGTPMGAAAGAGDQVRSRSPAWRGSLGIGLLRSGPPPELRPASSGQVLITVVATCLNRRSVAVF